MSGEITLRGRVLPIGGVREKILAAYRLKMSRVLLPKKNKKDLVEVPEQARYALEIIGVDHMDQVLEHALRRKPRAARRARRRTSRSNHTAHDNNQPSARP